MLRLPAAILALALAACATAAREEPSPQRREPEPSPKADRGSPRHQEWAEVKAGARAVRCFVVYPEVAKPAPAVLVIHENKGLTPWVRSVADRLAEEGFVAVAPDLLSGTGPSGGGTDAYAD